MRARCWRYKAVIQGGRADLRQLALYNLGNLHMRAGSEVRRRPRTQSLPLVELAKQSYRDLLRGDAAGLGRALQPGAGAVAGAGSG